MPVKVDREELPDVDQAYQSVCMAVTRHGGWPLTAPLSPDLAPFHTVTDFASNGDTLDGVTILSVNDSEVAYSYQKKDSSWTVPR